MKDLTPKQRRFVEEYCVDFNATQAAIRAGYSQKTSYSIGQENLKKPDIAEAIKKRLDELAMTAEEALKRLGSLAAGTVDYFMKAGDDGEVHINLGTEQARANYHLLKKVKQTRTITRGKDDYEREDIRTEFELYDAKSALVDILRIHGKFIEKREISGPGGGPMEIKGIDFSHFDEDDS